MKKLRLFLIVAMMAQCTGTATYASHGGWPVGVLLRGTVVLPDGSPAVGASVRIESVCDRNYRIVETDQTGSFEVSSFSPDCRDYKFTAGLKRGMWLPTGNKIFYAQPNGTTPVIHLESGTTPEPVTVRLQARGGEADFRVRDNATRSHLEAGISVSRIDSRGRGAVSFVVPAEGSIDLLPPGRYRIEVDRYICRSKQIWLVRKPWLDFGVIAGESHQVVVSFDTRTTKVRSSYDNLRGERCTP
jgi:hypothetical protein